MQFYIIKDISRNNEAKKTELNVKDQVPEILRWQNSILINFVISTKK